MRKATRCFRFQLKQVRLELSCSAISTFFVGIVLSCSQLRKLWGCGMLQVAESCLGETQKHLRWKLLIFCRRWETPNCLRFQGRTRCESSNCLASTKIKSCIFFGSNWFWGCMNIYSSSCHRRVSQHFYRFFNMTQRSLAGPFPRVTGEVQKRAECKWRLRLLLNPMEEVLCEKRQNGVSGMRMGCGEEGKQNIAFDFKNKYCVRREKLRRDVNWLKYFHFQVGPKTT